jgi:lipoprotein signal peptidase
MPWPFLVLLDLWSKDAAFSWMAENYGAGDHNRHLVFDSQLLRFLIVTWENPGTIWGLFQNGTVVLMVLRCCAVLGLVWFVAGTPRTKRFQLAVLSLIFAGAIGNLYDNFTRADALPARSVRDFLRFEGHWPVRWGFPAFNVADSCITVGAIGLLLLMLREDRESHRKAKAVSS